MTDDRSQLDAELHRATGRLHGLAAAGDRVATAPANDLRAFATSWALSLAGVTEVPLPAGATSDEAGELLADARPALLLAGHDTGAGVLDAARRLGLGIVDADADAAPRTPLDHAPRTRAMAYTSGTTGARKGVFAGVHDDDWGRAWLDDERAAFDHRHGDRHLVVSPLYHSGPFRHALVVADDGGAVEVLPRFDVDLWLEALRRFRPTSMFCVPTHLHRLLAHPGLRADDLASLTLLLHAGARCPTGLKHRVHDLAPDGSVWEFYGSTEGQFTSCPPDVWAASPGTVGTARHDRTITVLDDHGQEVPPGVTGTVWSTAPPHGSWTYWGRPEATAAAWDGDRFTVGDLGHLDEAGRLTLDGRPGDLVVTGGVNVYPAEVERVLVDCPDVGEVVVFGVPDEEWGERLVAAVVRRPGGPQPDVTAILDEARKHLSAARVPKDVLLVDDLPRTPTGKVRRTDLLTLVLP